MDISPTSISPDPSYHYQTSHPNPPQQSGQFIQPSPNTYNDRPGQQAYSPYPESSLQPPPSGQRHGSRSPHAGTVAFPEPQRGSSASHQQAYFPPSQTTQNLTVATHHQHERRGSHGHSPAIGSSSDSQRLYPAGAGSDTGGGSNFYSAQPGVQPHHGGGYTATATQPQAIYDEGHGSRPKAPPHQVTSGPKPLCRYPRCSNRVFFDRRVNELREWCSDQHMQAATMHRVEKPCKTCQVWPRRNGYKLCSGNVCRYPGYPGY